MKWLVYKYSVLFSILWILIIFVLCATPGQYIPSNNWLDLLSVDKLVHAGIFGTLMFLLLLVAIKNNYSSLRIACYYVFTVAYGVGLELMQAFVFSNRSADWKDAVANTFGATVVLLFISRIKRFYFKKNTGNLI